MKDTGVLHILTTFLFLSETHSHCFAHRGLEVRPFFTSTNAQREPMSSNARHSPAVASAQSSFPSHSKSCAGNKTSEVLRRYRDAVGSTMRRRRSRVSDFDYVIERETLLSDMEEVRHNQEKMEEEINKTRAEIATLKLCLEGGTTEKGDQIIEKGDQIQRLQSQSIANEEHVTTKVLLDKVADTLSLFKVADSSDSLSSRTDDRPSDAALHMAVMNQRSDSFALTVLRFIWPPLEKKRCKIIAI